MKLTLGIFLPCKRSFVVVFPQMLSQVETFLRHKIAMWEVAKKLSRHFALRCVVVRRRQMFKKRFPGIERKLAGIGGDSALNTITVWFSV